MIARDPRRRPCHRCYDFSVEAARPACFTSVPLPQPTSRRQAVIDRSAGLVADTIAVGSGCADPSAAERCGPGGARGRRRRAWRDESKC
jgi:hypothetical protein